MPKTRQLAAIMFTDIAGYTALMGEDEQKAFNLLKRSRAIQHPLIEQYGGRWIKELGDGVLASFPTATDAVFCAASIQKTCAGYQDIKIRIGIDLGEVVLENNDVFGDSVNIASRLQASAPVDSIWISEAVHKNVSNKKGIQIHFVREEKLKNVKEPVRVYEVHIDGDIEKPSRPVFLKKKVTKPIPQKSIAVLPFLNISNDPEQEYFSDGMAEEILNSLTHLKDLKVAGRTSSYQFKGKNVDLREVGQKLGVSTVLEGSVRKQGNRLRITAQLINVEDGFHFWSDKFDRNMDDIFAIQDEIALAITEQLKVTLLDHDRAKLTKTATQNAEAYQLYLKGRAHINRRGNFILTGMDYFEHAITIDPEYAPAYSGFADANLLAAFYGFISGIEAMIKVKKAAEMALKLDNTLAEAHCSLGSYYACFEWNWQAARKAFSKSLELNPQYAQLHSFYAMGCLAWLEGKFEEAEQHCQTAIKIDPLSAIDHADYAWVLLTAHKFEEALINAKEGIQLDANSFLSHRLAGLCYLALKRYAKAIEIFKYLSKISNRHQHALSSLIWAYSSNGNTEEAEKIYAELKKRQQTEYIGGTYFGLSAAYLNKLDEAFEHLEKAYRDHDPIIIQLKYSPYVPEVLKSDSRFSALIQRIGYPENVLVQNLNK